MTLAFRAFFRAIFSTIKRWKIVVFFFLFNAAFALLTALPLMTDISQHAGHFAGLKGFIDAFDAEILLDFNNARGAAGAQPIAAGPIAAEPIAAGIGIWGLVYFLLFNAVTAGAIGILADPRESTNLKTFFRAIGEYCFRFYRLLFYFALLLAAAAVLNRFLNGVVTWFFVDVKELGASSASLAWVMLAKNILMAIVLVFALLSFNYAKYAAVTEEGHFMGYYFFRGMGFTLAHPFATGIFFILSLVPIAAVIALYGCVSRTIDPHATYHIGKGILPFEWPVAGAVIYIAAAQAAQLMMQGCLFFRHAGQINIFKRIIVLTANPDPDLQKNVPESYFVVDRPAAEEGRTPAPKAGGNLKTAGFAAAAVLLAALAAAAPTPAAQAGPADAPAALSRRVVEYKIDAVLDPETWSVACRQHVAFENTTSKPTGELVFHLYANGHANSESVHQKGSTWAIDFNAADPALLGYIDIESVTLPDGSPLPAAPSIDDTIMRVPLPAPVAPGEKVSLNIAFRTKFPHRAFSRSGFIGRHLMAAQWYPKLSVLEEDGWTAIPYHPHAEYYGPFGVFDVSVTAPPDFEIEGSGALVEVSSSEDGARKTVRFRAADVHDFAWVADAGAELPVHSIFDGVKVVQVVQPYAAAKTDQISRVVKECLALYGDWYMPYPYERLVVAGAPHLISAGMEYPGLINVSFRFPLSCDWVTRNTLEPQGVTIHELTHQYFYGALASNEAAEPWLDEGLTTWSTAMALEAIYGPGESAPLLDRIELTMLFEVLNQGFGLYGTPGGGRIPRFLRSISLASFIGYDESPFHGPGRTTLLGYTLENLDLPGFNTQKGIWMKAEYAPFAGAAAPATAASDFYPDSYHPLAYSKAALSLQTLENHIGRARMKQLMRTYVERFKFQHPRTKDFLAVVNEVAGPELGGMMDTLIRTNAMVDFAVDSLDCRPITEPVGFVTQNAPGDEIVYQGPAARGAEPAAAPDGGAALPEAEGWEWDVIVTNRGQIEMPVEVELYFAGGRTVTHTYNGKRPFHKLSGKSPDRLVAAVVDPEHKFALDLNRINNARTAECQTDEVRFLSGIAHFWTQNFLNGWAFFN